MYKYVREREREILGVMYLTCVHACRMGAATDMTDPCGYSTHAYIHTRQSQPICFL